MNILGPTFFEDAKKLMTSVPDHVAQKTLPVLQKFLEAHQESTDGTSDDQLMSLEQLGITVSTEGKA